MILCCEECGRSEFTDIRCSYCGSDRLILTEDGPPAVVAYTHLGAPVSNTWTAKFHGTCVNCPTKVYPNDEVLWIGDPEDRVIAHATCPDPEAADLSAPYGVCGVCFQALPATRTCGWC